jgi:hypothetical protein
MLDAGSALSSHSILFHRLVATVGLSRITGRFRITFFGFEMIGDGKRF